MKTRLLLLTLTVLAFLAACQPAATAEPTALSTIQVTPVAEASPPRALIGEVLAGVQGNNNYEFIELMNPSLDEPFDLQGMSLWYQLKDGEQEEMVYRWEDHALIPPGERYLLGRADQDYGTALDALIQQPLVPQRGGLQLRAADGSVVDSLTWGSGPTAYAEGNPAPMMQNGVSLLRAGDSDDNASDFSLAESPSPQNSAVSSALEITLQYPEQVNPGDEFDLQIRLANRGEQMLQSVTAQVPLPRAFEVLEADSALEVGGEPLLFNQAGLNKENQVVLWRLDSLAAGEQLTASLRLKAPWVYRDILIANAVAAAEGAAQPAFNGPAWVTVGGGAIPIETARTLVGQEIIVEGIATMYTGGYYAGSGNSKFYLEDETGGIQVWVDDGAGDVNVALGDRVRVKGKLLLYRGALELAPASPAEVEILSRGEDAEHWPPTVVSVEQLASQPEPLAARLVQVEGTIARVEEFSYSYEIDLVDDEGHLVNVYVDKLTNISVETIESGERYRITGVLEARDDKMLLYPRLQGDLLKVYPPVVLVEMNAPNTAQEGETFTVTITVTNYRPEAVQDLTLTAPLPRFDWRVVAVAEGGLEGDDAITWAIPELAGEGASVSVSYQAQIFTAEASIRLPGAQVSAPGLEETAEGVDHLIFLGESVPIWAIQGEGMRSPYVFTQATTSGVVTGVFPDLEGFWIQALDPDNDPQTSDGLFINTGGRAVEVKPGDWVQVSGVVREAYQQTQLVVENSDDVVVLSSGHGLPNPVELDPPQDDAQAEAYYESLEGMFVQVTQPAIAVAPTNRYGEYALVLAEHGVERLWQGEPAGWAIVVDDGSYGAHDDRSTLSYVVNAGDQVTNLVGPLAYTFGNYKIEPVVTPQITPAEGEPPSLPLLAEDEFSLMTWNVENLFDFQPPNPSSPPMPTIDEYRLYIAKVANTILAAGAPTIVGLQEVENIGVLEDIAAHEVLAGYDYQPVLIEGTDSRGIDVGYLIRGDQARILQTQQFPAPEGLTSRPPLMVQVEITTAAGAVQVYVLNNHFTSMSGGEKATEPRRTAQAAWNVTVMEEILAADPGAYLSVMGDLNSYYDSLPVDTLRQAGLVHVFERLPEEERYTYIYRGRSQSLDHILVTANLMDALRRVDVLHVNADYAIPAPGDESPLRKSDHDPVVAVFGVGSE